MGTTYTDSLKAEAQSWAQPDTSVSEKLLRERIRHPKLIRDLLLDRLPTRTYNILEVGGGPLPVSDLLPFNTRVVVDPCSDTYRDIAPCNDHITAEIEDYPLGLRRFDLVLCTNALDHVRDVSEAIGAMDTYLLRGGFMAVMCAENNAIIHKHPSHQINLTAWDLHEQLDNRYETVQELTYDCDGYRYGWKRFDGRCGQPAFAWLGRKAYP